MCNGCAKEYIKGILRRINRRNFWSLLWCWWISQGLCGNTSTARSDCGHLLPSCDWTSPVEMAPMEMSLWSVRWPSSWLAGRMQVRIKAPGYKLEVIVAVVNSTQNLSVLMRAEFEWRSIGRAYCRKGDLSWKKDKTSVEFLCFFVHSEQHICVHGQRHSKSLK